jgi:hypothetical protein
MQVAEMVAAVIRGVTWLILSARWWWSWWSLKVGFGVVKFCGLLNVKFIVGIQKTK